MLAREAAGRSIDRSEAGLGPAIACLSIAFAALLAFRVAALWLNATDLFFDEAQYWWWSEELAFGYFSKPPLIAWIIAISTSLCGHSEFCIRLPSPIIHTLTAVFVYGIGRQLGGSRVGVWSALAFATVPGVSFSSGIISTDVPLLACWAAALWALLRMLESEGWSSAIALGVAMGLGLNAKYAMVFFPLCLAVYLAATPERRALLRDPRLYVAAAIAGALIAPNMAWNLSNGFVTFTHTADNARWDRSLINPGRGLEFVASQLGVFGPILVAALIQVVVIAWRQGLAAGERLLLAFTLPVLVVITAQAFVSRAHANWAATAYVAASVLVVAVLLRQGRPRVLWASLALHLAVGLLIGGLTWQARAVALPGASDLLARTLGWRELADETGRTLKAARDKGQPYRAIITDDRSVTAELLYYLRAEPTPVLAWLDGGRIHDHFELTRPLKDRALEPILLVSVRRDAAPVTDRFAAILELGQRTVPTAKGLTRSFRLYSLTGFRGPASAPTQRKK